MAPGNNTTDNNSSSSSPAAWDDYERGLSPQRTISFSSSVGSRSGRSGDVRGGDGEEDYSRQDSEDASLLRRQDSGGGGATGSRRGGGGPEDWPALRRRRSSVTNRLAALAEIGGVNSIRSFTRSWQRAAGFAEVIPQRPAFVFPGGDQAPMGAPEAFEYPREDIEAAGATPNTSLLRQRLEGRGGVPGVQVEAGAAEEGEEGGEGEGEPTPGASSGAAAAGAQRSPPAPDFRERERKMLEAELSSRGARFSVGSAPAGAGGPSSIFAVPPHLATPPLVGSYGSYGSYGGYGGYAGSYGTFPGYGTLDSTVSRPSMDLAGTMWQQQQEAGVNVPDGQLEPILVKEVEEDGKIILTVEGQSTLPQTIFNSINVLIGVGLLSLPMGIKYSGWLCGMLVLFLCAAVTAYTARLLARCMDLDRSVITFSDLAYISFGPSARVATSILFTLELLAACVALIVLFADSLELLLPGLLTVTEWKVLFAVVMIPLNFLPLRFLSFTSVIGILSCFSIVTIIIIDGLVKRTSPGSLIEPATTYLFPANWLTLPLSFGLLMSPWGGHSVFPNIYRDMRHPHKYARAVKVTFSFTYLLDAATAVAGVLMFGDQVMDEITSNVLTTSGYPRALTLLMCCLIAVLPLTKIPLNARPIVTTAEVLLGLHQQQADAPVSGALVGRSMYFRGAMKVVIRVATILVFLVISILFPAFDSIMAFMGSALCFTICVTLPLAFYLKLFAGQIPARERVMCWCIMAASVSLSLVGTVWAFLPKSLIGAG